MTEAHIEIGASPPDDRSEICAGLLRNFVVLCLLTGSQQEAERALLRAISMAANPASEDEILRLVLPTAVLVPLDWGNGAPADQMSFPPEIERLLSLSPERLRIFVLRFVAHRTTEECATLLQIEGSAVDELSCAALVELAQVASQHCDFKDVWKSSWERKIKWAY